MLTIQFFCKGKGGIVYDDHQLKLGTYNEYYLPAIHQQAEAWIVVTDDEGVETKLHLKR